MVPTNRFLSIVALGFIAVIFNSCSSMGSKMDRQINISNASSHDVTVEIWDKESSNTLDVAPTIAADNETFHRINAGEDIVFPAVEIEGNYQVDKPDRLFLYEIEGDSAHYQQSFDIAPNANQLTIQQDGDSYLLQRN